MDNAMNDPPFLFEHLGKTYKCTSRSPSGATAAKSRTAPPEDIFWYCSVNGGPDRSTGVKATAFDRVSDASTSELKRKLLAALPSAVTGIAEPGPA